MTDFLIRKFPKEIMDKIDGYQKLGRVKNRTHGVIRLCEIAIDFLSMDREDPELVRRIREKWALKHLDDLMDGVTDEDKRIFHMWLTTQCEDPKIKRLIL